MTKGDRRLERLRRSTRSVSPQELHQVLVDFGFVRARVAGSHQLYKHPALKERLVIPRRRPILPVYIKQALEAIDEVRSKGEPEQ